MSTILWILISLFGIVCIIFLIRAFNKLLSGQAQGSNPLSKFYDACCQAAR